MHTCAGFENDYTIEVEIIEDKRSYKEKEFDRFNGQEAFVVIGICTKMYAIYRSLSDFLIYMFIGRNP